MYDTPAYVSVFYVHLRLGFAYSTRYVNLLLTQNYGERSACPVQNKGDTIDIQITEYSQPAFYSAAQ